MAGVGFLYNKLQAFLAKVAPQEAKPEEALALIGSHGYVEIAINQGNAAEKFKAKPGHTITISPTQSENMNENLSPLKGEGSVREQKML